MGFWVLRQLPPKMLGGFRRLRVVISRLRVAATTLKGWGLGELQVSGILP